MRASILCLFLVGTAFADEAPAPQKPLWEKSAELTFLLTSGNTQVTSAGLGIALLFRPGAWTFTGKTSYLSNQSAGTLTANTFTFEARADRKIAERLSIYLQDNYFSNPFAGFNHRNAAELGLAYSLLEGPEHTLSAELAGGAQNENRTDGTTPAFAFMRVGLSYQWKFSESADFTSQVFLQDSLYNTADWRLSNTNSLTATLTSVLSLKASFKVDYINLPVTGKVSTDTSTNIALVAKF